MIRPPLAAIATIAAIFLLMIGLMSACSNGDDPGGSSGSSGGRTGACQGDSRKDVYTAGLTKQGTGLSVRIVDANPAPPAKGTNVMTLQVVDAAGKGVDNAALTVIPFMPDHGHGSAVLPIAKPAGDGKYNVEKIYLSMAGLWTLTVKVEMSGSPAQELTFAFCLDG